jgi:acetyltransferase-like isoleucine patch superfamily enzyme
MEKFYKTCSIFNLKDEAITFIKEEKYIKELFTDKRLLVLAPSSFRDSKLISDVPINVSFSWSKPNFLDFDFFSLHNEIYADSIPPEATIGKNCNIHDSVVMDVDGIKFANGPDGTKIQFQHTGNVIIEDDVDIGPLCVVHRGTLDSTIIKRGVKLASKINVGHNAIIGENTVIASGAILAGSHYGKNCWIGMGAIINQGLTICDYVVIGSGAVVTKNIEKSGIYVGNPAKFIKPITEGWNF